MKLTYTLPKSGTGDDFKKAFIPFLDRAGQEVARSMRRRIAANKSVAFSTLVNSIQVLQDGELGRFVAPSVNYARMVDEGTGPAAGRKRYFPDPKALEPYVKLRSRITITGKPGSPQRKAQRDEIRDRAQALARYIYVHGTKPHPFVEPTRDDMQARVIELLTQGAQAGAAAQLGAG